MSKGISEMTFPSSMGRFLLGEFMEQERKLFTSESVSEGHPDKVCDQISDAILDECLKKDKNSRVACEVFATGNYVLVGGEITTKCPPNYAQIVKNVLKDIGYDRDELGTNYNNVIVDVKVKEQSLNISDAVTNSDFLNIGAGDQGIMFGYATTETSNYIPLALAISHKLVRVASNLRKEGKFKYARPDMKSQVTIDYTDEKNPRIHTILMSVQHEPGFDQEFFKDFILKSIMIPVAKSFGLNTDFDFLINPSGRFEIGGPQGDTGLTGRKIIVDTYGGYCEHGGGAFSGKDPTKVDRSAAYYARYIAKNLVASGIAEKIKIQLSYAIGVPNPLSINVDTYNTSTYSNDLILKIINELFDCRPGSIIKQFKLNEPSFSYRSIASYGHFGRNDLNLPWENLDKVKEIKEFLKKIN